MKKCFVMQPFDGGTYDKRYESVFAPAIAAAGLEPYRVDRDPSVSIPINDIENGIRNSDICFAEISTDNPNVWFELGFALAVPKEVLLVSSDERKAKYPFDVQHRNIIKYGTAAPQDFDDLKKKITQRIAAILTKNEEIGRVASLSPVKETEGLNQHEVVALVAVMQNAFMSEGSVSAYRIKDDMNNSGFTDIAVSLGLKSLDAKGMIERRTQRDENGEPYSVFEMTQKGEAWLIANQERLILQRKSKPTTELPF